ncbi:hypothetical protein O3M35_002900 [Rhynocoris fuscipes]|uniref:Uncharacterized protein n=1 Tax=Rhynocoris fuscipes TaxID=488301 RepID=A0AAW1CQI6_9HEMI
MDSKVEKDRNEESESQISRYVVSSQTEDSNNNITNDNIDNDADNVNPTEHNDQIDNQHNVNIENQTGGSVFIICQNDSSTISTSSRPLLVNIGQNQVFRGIHCNRLCLQSRTNHTTASNTRRSSTSVRRSNRRVRRTIWQRRRVNQTLRNRPEQTDFQATCRWKYQILGFFSR